MIRKITLLFLLCFGVQQAANAQARCGFDQTHQTAMNNSTFAQGVNQLNANIASWLATQPNPNSLIAITSGGDTVYEIPLVVHVMHTGGAIGTIYNPTDARIINTINYVNEVFAATYSSYPDTANGGTYFPFRFKLAQRSPNCTATTGITRTNVSAIFGYGPFGYNYAAYGVRMSNPPGQGVADEFNPPTYKDSLKRLSRWPNDRYYNIWVVNKLDGNDGTSGSFTAGYAFFPSTHPEFYRFDGTIMLATQMNVGRITLPHELGHAFSLYHTFEGSNGGTTCPTNTNCTTDGDRCCDTEPHKDYGPGTCNSGKTNVCTSNTFADATARNIMNYANCQNRFTKDQRDRFIGALVSQRSSLISSSGSLPIPTTGLPTVCTPGSNNPTATSNYGPRNIKIADAGRTYLDVTSSGFFTDGQLAYIDNTCAHQVILQAGNSYQITVTSLGGEKGVVFLDYNNDGILGNTTGERINVTSTGSSHTASFTIPQTATKCTPIRMRVITDFTTNRLDSCSNMNFGQAEDYEVLILGASSGTATVTVSNPPIGGNPSCQGTSLKFYAVPSSNATVVNYQWFKNSTPLGGQTTDTLVDPGGGSTIFNNDDTAWVQLRYTNVCGVDTVVSNRVVVKRAVTINPAVTIGVTGGTNPTCIDDTVTLSVVSNVNPGGAPTYQWRRNGADISGATSTSYKSIGNGGDKFTVRMTSSADSPCALPPKQALSNEIEITYTQKVPIANIALTVGTNPGCAGQPLQFTATPTTGGTAPSYQWTVNGSSISGATNVNYTTSMLQNNDIVRVIMTSNSPCASPKVVVSDSVVVKHEKITADITIAQTTGGNPACEGHPVIFSANTINAGKNPKFQWMVNGLTISGATTPIYVTDSLRNTDRVQCILIATDSCVANPRDTSTHIEMLITPSKRPKVTVAITKGKNPGCLDSLIEFTATAIDLGSNPDFRWLVNGFPLVPGATFTISTLQDGDQVSVRANQTDNGCYLPDTVYSTPMIMVRSITPDPPIISLIGNKMYTNFDSSFVWFGPRGEMPDGPKGVAYPDTIGAYYAVTNNRGCWSKPSNILRITLLDLSTIDLTGLDVYPNPTSDIVVLDWHGKAANYGIDVYNSIGQVVMTDEVRGASKKEVSLRAFADGNYYIVLKDSEGNIGVMKVALKR
ncbi:MAG: T9SS type A sorting domain-containing protein [Chitinophagales bacterium]|nr:zinc-dependent metalloprotease [Chitinophagaceae bacterium]MCB9063594.1 T9SS type A sorting domain-containing protein [Chitinophagales bacterium]